MYDQLKNMNSTYTVDEVGGCGVIGWLTTPLGLDSIPAAHKITPDFHKVKLLSQRYRNIEWYPCLVILSTQLIGADVNCNSRLPVRESIKPTHYRYLQTDIYSPRTDNQTRKDTYRKNEIHDQQNENGEKQTFPDKAYDIRIINEVEIMEALGKGLCPLIHTNSV